jgi:4-aminobutyrate aminotransferase-like enzyme
MLRDRNVLVGIAGPYGNVLKIRPPLTFKREHVDILATALSDSLASLP